MSTEHQRYSIDNQIDAIREFAETNEFKIVRTYSDPGKSGLTLKNRPGMQRLLDDVASGNTPFRRLLVYDVSRWGRFQDPDEGAAYEHHCRSRGIEIIYCTEQFDNTGGSVNSLLKHLKRTMAAEFSRDLSLRITRGKKKVAHAGYWAGGIAPYGYERWALGDGGREIRLEAGESKHVNGWRTVLKPGPEHEVKAVQRIFRLYLEHERSIGEIAGVMNAEGWPTRTGSPWCYSTIQYMLLSEAYAGGMVYGRSARELGAPGRRRPTASDWVRKPAAFPPIVPMSVVESARRRFKANVRARPHPSDWTDEQMLAGLSDLHKKHGRLNPSILASDRTLPAREAYVERFGSLGLAFGLAGDRPDHFRAKYDHARQSSAARAHLAGELRLALAALGVTTKSVKPNLFELGPHRIATRIANPCFQHDHPFWAVSFAKAVGDVLIVSRHEQAGAAAVDYWLIHLAEFSRTRLSIGPKAYTAAFVPWTTTVDEAADRLRAFAMNGRF